MLKEKKKKIGHNLLTKRDGKMSVKYVFLSVTHGFIYSVSHCIYTSFFISCPVFV